MSLHWISSTKTIKLEMSYISILSKNIILLHKAGFIAHKKSGWVVCTFAKVVHFCNIQQIRMWTLCNNWHGCLLPFLPSLHFWPWKHKCSFSNLLGTRLGCQILSPSIGIINWSAPWWTAITPDSDLRCQKIKEFAKLSHDQPLWKGCST